MNFSYCLLLGLALGAMPVDAALRGQNLPTIDSSASAYGVALPDTLTEIAPAFSNSSRYAGKVILVTGGTSGIGFHSAAAFYQECAAAVVVAARNSAAGDLSVKVLKNLPRTGCNSTGIVKYVKLDIRHRQQLRNLMNVIDKQFGKLDVAVLAAGIPGTMTAFANVADSEWLDQSDKSSADPILNNLYGTMYSTQEILRLWQRTNSTGNIVTISSQDGLNAGGEWYGTSKHGIIGFTSSVGLAYGKNNTNPTRPSITARVNSVAPGMTDTPFTWNQAALFDKANNGKVEQIGQCIVTNSQGEKVINGQCVGGGTGYTCPCPDVTRQDAYRIFGAIEDKSDLMHVLTLPGRVLPPAAIAKRILFLASDTADELDINGQTYFVSNYPGTDGGDQVCASSYLADKKGCQLVGNVGAYEQKIRSGNLCPNC